MSQNIQLGIAAICGGATYGLSSLANLSSSVGIAFAIAVAGLVLILLATKDTTSVEEPVASKKPKKEHKKSAPSPQKSPQKAPKTPKVEKEEPVEVLETPDKSKKKKKGKKSGGTPLSSPVSPQPTKAKATPKVEEDKEDKEKSKHQLRKLKKKEAEQKQKAEEEKQRAAELAKKAAEQKREKKLQAKARKASQKAAQEVKAEPKVELKQSLDPEPGWEVNTNRKPRGPKDGKESREPIVVDVKVPVRSHALIIGKQGEGLRKLTEDLDVIITMPKRDSGDDLILIKGLPKDVHMAKRAILELATKGYSSVTQPGWVTKTFQLKNKYQLALVFGERGSTLQSISKASGTRVQMPEKKVADKNDKEKKLTPEQLQLTVTGEERAIDTAFSLIQELIDQGYTKTTHPDWVGDEVHVGEQAMGAIIGPRGARIKELSKKFKVKVDVPPRSDPTVKNEVLYVKGLPKHVALFKQEIADILASREAPIEQEVPDPAWQEDVQEVAW